MKKIDFLIICLIILIVCSAAFLIYSIKILPDSDASTVYVAKSDAKKKAGVSSGGGKFLAYSDDFLIGEFAAYEDAVNAAAGFERAGVKAKGSEDFIWDNYPPYKVYTSTDKYEEFENMLDAINRAMAHKGSSVYYGEKRLLFWENRTDLPPSFKIEGVGVIYQMPELARGCEVTSLAMLINFFGTAVDKMTLADEIAKDDAPPYYENGKLYRGNPNVGFVGDMTALNTYGLGVYHKPIHDLLIKYFPENAVDLSGVDFDVLYYYISNKSPVWIITNATFAPLGESSFETWNTKDGEIKITYREHSVLITGYDEDYIYFADPLSGLLRAPKKNFIKAWEQMGSQAVTVLP